MDTTEIAENLETSPWESYQRISYMMIKSFLSGICKWILQWKGLSTFKGSDDK